METRPSVVLWLILDRQLARRGHVQGADAPVRIALDRIRDQSDEAQPALGIELLQVDPGRHHNRRLDWSAIRALPRLEAVAAVSGVHVQTFPGPRNPTPDACYPPFCLLHFCLDTPTHSW